MNLLTLRESVRAFFSEELNMGIIWSMTSLGVLAISGVMMNSLIIFFRGEEALGVFNQVYAVYVIASQISVGGLQFSVLKNVSQYSEDEEQVSHTTSSALLLVFLITSTVAFLGWYAAPSIGSLLQSGGVTLGIRVVMPGLVFFCLNKILINAVNGLEKMKEYAIFRSSRYAMIPLFLFGMLVFRLDSALLVLALVFSELVLFFGLLVFLNNRYLTLKFLSIPRQQYLAHLRFASKGFFSGVLVQLNTRIDVLILGILLDDYSVGVYIFAASIAEGYRQLSMAIRWNVDPQLGKFIAKKANHEIEALSRKIRLTYFLPILIVGALGMGAYFVAIRVLTGEYNWHNTMLVVIMILGVIIGNWYRPFVGLLLQGGKPEIFSLYVLLLLIGDASLNLLVVPYVGIMGAAIVTAVTYSLEGYYLKVLARRLFHIDL